MRIDYADNRPDQKSGEAELEYKAVLSEVPLESESTRYTGVILQFDHKFHARDLH